MQDIESLINERRKALCVAERSVRTQGSTVHEILQDPCTKISCAKWPFAVMCYTRSKMERARAPVGQG